MRAEGANAEAVCAHKGWNAANRDFMTAVGMRSPRSFQVPGARSGVWRLAAP
jgi:hypothetical protein